MTGFRANSTIWAWSAVVCLAMMIAPIVTWAQSADRPASFVSSTTPAATPDTTAKDAPLALAPSLMAAPTTQSATPPAPTTAVPTATTTAPASATAPATPVIDMGQPVTAAPLEEVKPDSIGLLTNNQDGLGASMWKGTSRQFVTTLLPTINLPGTSPTLNNLARRLLLTTATAPEGSDAKGITLTAVRAERLVALGYPAEAWKLTQLAKADQFDEITYSQIVEAGLVTPSIAEDVCRHLPDIMKSRSSLEWQKPLAICQLRAKDIKAAQVAVDLLRAQGDKDETFAAIIEKNLTAGAKQLPRQLTPLKATTLALIRMTDLPLRDEIYAHADPALFPELTQTKPTNPFAITGMVEQMAKRGLATSEMLRNAYLIAATVPDDPQVILSTHDRDIRSRAILLQALMQEKDSKERITKAGTLLEAQDITMRLGAYAQMIAETVSDITPNTDLNPLSGTMAEIQILGGKPDYALSWLKQARIAAIGIPAVADTLRNLWPIIALAGFESEADFNKHLTEWEDRLLVAPDDGKTDMKEPKTQVQNILQIVAAAGFAIPDDAWDKCFVAPELDKHPYPAPYSLYNMQRAAAAGRRGETILAALSVFSPFAKGSGSNNHEPPLYASLATITALRQVGLNSDAALLAKEVAMGLLEKSAGQTAR